MTMTRISKIVLVFILILVFVLPISGNFVFGEENLSERCEEIINKGQQNLSKENYQSLLKECQVLYEEKISEIEKDISKTGEEKKTLQNKIWSLSNKIENLNYQIYQSNLVIKDLGIQIEDTGTSIEKTSLKIEGSKEKLSGILRTIYEEDQKPVIEILLSEPELSDFFDNLVALEILNNENRELLENIKDLKSNLEQQSLALGQEKGDLEQTVQIQTLQKNESAKTKEEQQYYWNLTEQEFQKQLREKEEVEKKAAEIEAKILKLVGLPEEQQINLGQAIEIAKYVETKTGIRPAFLIGLISGESALGRNVGECYLKDSKTGDGIRAITGKQVKGVMKPMGLLGRKGDVDDFLAICEKLPNRDAYSTKVSCPSPDYAGYGGAMGPAQFMPTTWVFYEKRIETIIGKLADPWKPLDAFLAAGLFLRDAGAAKQTYNAEWIATVTYLHGSYSSLYDWYFKSYINPRASCIQVFIDQGTMSFKCEELIF